MLGRRRDPPLLAPGAPRSGARRLRRRARGRAPGRDEPLAALLGAARAASSQLARDARGPRAGQCYAAPPERQTMRLLHTVLHVGDLQASVKSYTDVLGIKLLR